MARIDRPRYTFINNSVALYHYRTHINQRYSYGIVWLGLPGSKSGQSKKDSVLNVHNKATQQIANQNAFWENQAGESINVEAVRVAHSSGTNAMLVKKPENPIGAGKLLKVMAGDKIHTTVQFYYSSVDADNSAASGIESLISNIATLVATSVVPGGAIKDGAMNMASTLSAQPTLASMLNTNPNTSGTNKAPKAYLNILLFNEQFQFDAVNSKVLPVWYNRNTWATLSRVGATAVQAMKNGYAYVYFSNESKENVYFDNFTLTHERGPILEETHYYPFGLTMAGISSRAMGKTPNRFKFNDGTELENNEFSDGSGLELYATDFRSYDPQIGRFLQIDALSLLDYKSSPYSFASNNPVLMNDPLGLLSDSANPQVLQEVFVTAKIPKRLPSATVSSTVNLPYAEINDLALDRNMSNYDKIQNLRSITKSWINPQAARSLDGKLLKNTLSYGVLRSLQKMFTVVDFYSVAMMGVNGNSTTFELPIVGGLTQMIVEDMVSASDEIILDFASKKGYVDMARVLNSSVGRRSGLVGVYASKGTMQAILADGGLNTRIHMVTQSAGEYQDDPRASDGSKFEYFIIFPRNSRGTVTNFGVMPIR